MYRIVWGLAVAALVAGAEPAFAANYPLEFSNPRSGLSTNHRFRRAYPGLEYNVKAAVVGGAYPFIYSLSNAPTGMTIDAQTGEIRWPNPQANASPTITVVDAEGTRISVTWSIAVTTTGFKFVDAVNGSSSGSGAISSPYRSMLDVQNRAAVGDFVYFRNGTYRVTDLPRDGVGGPWERVTFNEDRDPTVWLAYPGHTPQIDFAYTGGSEAGPLIRLTGDNVYVEGFETRNARHIAFQYETSPGGTGPTFRRVRMRDLLSQDGTNTAFIMTTTTPTPATHMVVQDSEFQHIYGDNSGVTIKVYAQLKLLIENTVHHDGPQGIELKDDVRQFTVRGNEFYDISGAGMGGNMQEVTTNGEFVFNNSRGGTLAIDLNQNGMARQLYVQRNTLIGRVRVRNTDSADGPFYIGNNVIVNTDSGTPTGSHVYHLDVSAPQRVVLSNNLAGDPAQNIVDSGGNLTSAYANYIGTHGHMVGAGGGTPSAPRAPSNLRIVTGQ